MERALEGIARSGVKYVGLMRQQGQLPLTADSTPQQIDELSQSIGRNGLRCLACLHPVEVDLPLGKAIARLKRAIANIAALEGQVLLTTGCGDPAKYDRYFEVVSSCTDYAAQKGVMIALKPHGGLSATGKECREAVERVASDNFRIWYDPGNVLWYTGGFPHEDVGTAAEYVVGMCVKDCRTGDNGTVMVTPGEGKVDFAGLFRVLNEAGFCGPCLVETLSGTTPDEIDAAARKAVAFLRDTLSGV